MATELTATMTPFEWESLKRQEIERFHDMALDEEARREKQRREWDEDSKREICPCGCYKFECH